MHSCLVGMMGIFPTVFVLLSWTLYDSKTQASNYHVTHVDSSSLIVSKSYPKCSRIQCAARCKVDPDCSIFQYSKESGTCSLLSNNHPRPVSSPGGVAVLVDNSMPFCQDDWFHYLPWQVCVKLFSTLRIWAAAQQDCQGFGGNLATVQDAEMSTYLIGLNPSESPFWIGANDMETEGNFTWVDGTPWGGFTNFDAGQPNDFGDGEDCLEVAAHRDWKWNDADCTFTRTYFCVV